MAPVKLARLSVRAMAPVKLAGLSTQMIIAMKGHSSFHTSNIAQKIASLLKHPLINEDDIFPFLQKSLPSTSYKKFSKDSNIDLIFDIVSQISSTQINLNLSVVINMQLSQPAHYDRLVELADSTGATLVIIHAQTEKDKGGHDVGVGHVPTVSIDTTKPFNVEDLVRLMLQAAREKKNVDYHKPKGDVPDASQSDRNKKDERDLVDMHVHEFELCKEPKKEKLSCTKCKQLIISGPTTYHCVECDDFILHKDCAESPTFEKLMDTNQHQFLMENPPEKYIFSSRTEGCQFCHEFRATCPDCLLLANIKGEYLPTIYNYRNHQHPLNFIIMPFSFNYQYKCSASACGKMGKFVSYKCFQCNYDLHIKCALVVTKDVILQKINLGRNAVQIRYNEVEKLLDDEEITKRDEIALRYVLMNDGSILRTLDKISKDLNVYSVDKPVPLQDAYDIINLTHSCVNEPFRVKWMVNAFSSSLSQLDTFVSLIT